MQRAPIFFLLLSSLVSFLSLPAQGPGPAIDRYLSEEYEAGVTPGLAAVVVRGEQVIFSKGYGVEVLGSGRPMTPRSVSGIASITKSLTAFAMMRLVEAGKVDLDAPVTRYLPWFRTANEEWSDRITVRMLLNNTAGLPTDYRLKSTDLTDAALERSVRALAGVYLPHPPGTRYAYSNRGFTVAGLLIGRVSGQSYGSFLQQEVFDPLEMAHSSVDPSRFCSLGALYGHSYGIDRALPASPQPLYGEYIPAGSVTRSTAEDLGNYLIALLNRGRYQGRQLLRPESIEALFTPQARFPGLHPDQGGDGRPVHYGLGWMMGEIDGRQYVLHGGSAGTMSALLVLSPEEKLGAAVLFNLDLNFIDPYRYTPPLSLLNNIIRLAAGEPVSEYGRPRIEDPTLNAFQLPDSLRRRYCGRYDLTSNNGPFILYGADLEIEVSAAGTLLASWRRGDELVLQGRLDFVNEALAVIRNIHRAVPLRFRLRPNGQVTGIYFEGMLGADYRRRNPSLKEGRQAVTTPAARFYLPASWSLSGSESRRTAVGEEREIRIWTLDERIEQNDGLRRACLAGHTIVMEGKQQNEQWKDGHWRQQSLLTEQNGIRFQHLLLWRPAERATLLLCLTTPEGRLTGAIREILSPMMRSMELRRVAPTACAASR